MKIMCMNFHVHECLEVFTFSVYFETEYHFQIFSLQVKKHIKQGQGHEGGIFTVEAPLHVSNVQVVDPVTGYAWMN